MQSNRVDRVTRKFTEKSIDRTYLIYSLVVSYLLLAPKKVLPGCPIHFLFGIYCPACGATRALRAALSGDISRALHDNLLALTSPGFMLIGVLMQRRGFSSRSIFIFCSAIGLLTLVFTILRNSVAPQFAPLP